MLIILLLLPWVLTLLALLFIIVRSDTLIYEEDEDDDDEYDNDQDVVRVAVYEDKAYWVYNNVFYESEITREPDFETAKPIDTMSMNSKDLNKLLNILDEIEESGKE